MDVRRVEPDEAAGLLHQGWIYLDVRSVIEFDQGHPEGAYNIPLLDVVPGQGMRPNTGFLDEVSAAFPADTRLVVGCKSAGRSARAAQMLQAGGFGSVVDMSGGFSGEGDAMGRLVCVGWEARGLPVALAAAPGRSYAELKAKR